MSSSEEERYTPLGELASVSVGHVGPMASRYVPEGIPFLRSQNVQRHRIDLRDVRYIDVEFHNELKKSILQPGDVVVVRTGAPGTAAVVPRDLSEANCADLVVIRPHAQLDSRFLSYYINGAAQYFVRSRLVGAVQQHFNISAARELLIPDLRRSEQEAIAEVLGAFDDKIESNLRLCALLEEAAAALFRARFIDFVGVADLAQSEIGPIPRGWTVGCLADVAEVSRTSINPSDTPEALFEHFSIPAFDAGGNPEIVQGREMLSAKARLPMSPAILLSKLNPHTRRVWRPRPRGRGIPVCSPEFVVLVPTRGTSFGYLDGVLTADRAFYGRLLGYTTGTTGSRQRIKPGDVMATRLVLPPSGERLDHGERVGPLLAYADGLRDESEALAAVRDAVLPRLVSGQIRVRDAEDLAEAI